MANSISVTCQEIDVQTSGGPKEQIGSYMSQLGKAAENLQARIAAALGTNPTSLHPKNWTMIASLVDETAAIGFGTKVKFSAIGRKAQVGEHTEIENSNLASYTIVGSSSKLTGAELSRGCFVDAQCMIGFCILGSNVRVGRNVTIGTPGSAARHIYISSQARIGDDTRIEPGVSIGRGVVIGMNSYLAEGTRVAPFSCLPDGFISRPGQEILPAHANITS